MIPTGYTRILLSTETAHTNDVTKKKVTIIITYD